MDFSKSPTNCAQNIGVDLNRVNQCVEGERGVQLQLNAEKFSFPFIQKSAFVPTVSQSYILALSSFKKIVFFQIVYNNVYNAGDFWESLDDFESIVRDKLKNL